MITLTGTSLITRSLQDLQVLGVDETLSGEALGVCLGRLQELIDAWGIDGLTMPTFLRTVGNIVSGTQSYTIGAGATFNVARPKDIEAAAYIPDPSAQTVVEIPIEILTPQRYAQWPAKLQPTPYPQAVFYDHSFDASGFGRILLLPMPSSSLPDLVLYTAGALTGFVDATTAYGFAPGTATVLRTQLALDLAAIYPGAVVTKDYKDRADAAFRRLAYANARPIELGVDPVLLVPKVSDIYSDV